MVAPYIADLSGERLRLGIASPNSSPRLSCVLDRASQMVCHAQTRKDDDRLCAYHSTSSASARMAYQLLTSLRMPTKDGCMLKLTRFSSRTVLAA